MKLSGLQERVEPLLDLAQQAVLPILAVGTLVVGANALKPTEAVAEGAPNQQQDYQSAPHLRNMRQLPGFHLDVTKREQAELDNSTLKLTARPYGPQTAVSSSWNEWCTMLNVSLPGVSTTYDLTANHCFPMATGSVSGSFFNSLEPHMTALNYINDTYLQYDVVDPHAPTYERDNFPIAMVGGLSIDTAGVDQALLSIEPPIKADQTAPYNGERPYSHVPAVPITRLVTAAKEPIVGQQVALYGIPQANNNIPVPAKGRYIGRYTLNSYDDFASPSNGTSIANPPMARKLDMVAVPASLPQTDPCGHGSSGGSAVTATGQFFGSLSYRLSTGYGPKHDYANSAVAAYNKYMVGQVEQSLGVKIAAGNTICGFSVLPKNIGYTLLTGLTNYFNFSKGGGGQK